MRDIDADALIAELEWIKEQTSRCNHPHYDEMIERVNSQPTTEVEKVVRCKDCRYSMLWTKNGDAVTGSCCIREMYSDGESFPKIGENDFCSYGYWRDER